MKRRKQCYILNIIHTKFNFSFFFLAKLFVLIDFIITITKTIHTFSLLFSISTFVLQTELESIW